MHIYNLNNILTRLTVFVSLSLPGRTSYRNYLIESEVLPACLGQYLVRIPYVSVVLINIPV